MSHCKKRGWINNMNIRLCLKFGDIVKMIFGGTVLVFDTHRNSIYSVCMSEDTYICKG